MALTSDFDLARRLFGTPEQVERQLATSAQVVRGRATADSGDGVATVVLDADAEGATAEVEVPTSNAIEDGDEVLVTIVNGSPVECVSAGSGDRMAAAVQDAHDLAASVESIAQEAAAEVEQVRQDVADYRADTYTKAQTDKKVQDLDDAISTELTTNYTNNQQLSTTYATKTLVSQTKDAIELAASQTYETQSDAAATYATKSALTVGLDGIRSEVAEDYQPKGDYATTASMNSAIQQSASSIESSVAATYETKSDAATTYATKTEVQQTAAGLDTRITTAQSTADGAYLERSGTGTTIDTTGAATIRSLIVEGQSVQDGTPTPDAPVPIASVEGRNLLDAWLSAPVTSAGVTYTNGADGSVVLNGTKNGSGYAIVKSGLSLLLPAGTYRFNAQLVSGTATNAPTIYLLDASSTAITSVSPNVSGALASATVTVSEPKTVAILRFALWTDGSVYTGATYKVWLERGTTAHPYQPYGCVTLVAQSRNLLDSGADATSTNAANHITTTRTNGVYRLTGTSATTGGRLDAIYKNLTTLQAGTYTLSQETSGTGNYTAFLHDENNVILAQLPYDRPSVNVTLDATTRVFVGINVTQIGTYDRTIAFQIERGTTATAYTPYVNSRTDIDLQGHALRSLPDGTYDEMAVDSLGRVTMTQRVGELSLSSSQTWTNNAARGTNVFYVSLSGVNNASSGLCDRFELVPIAQIVNTEGKFAYGQNTVNFSFPSTVTTVEGAKAWIDANPTTVLYPLATPQTIDLGTIDLPTPADTLWLDAALVPTIEATWWTVGGIAGQQALDAEVTERQTLIRQFSGGVLAGYVGNAIAALVNAAGSFDVVRTAWSGGVPSILGTLARYAASGISLFDAAGNTLAEFASDHVRIGGDVPIGDSEEVGAASVQFFDQTNTHTSHMDAFTSIDEQAASGDYGAYYDMRNETSIATSLDDDGRVVDTNSNGTASVQLKQWMSYGITDVDEQWSEVTAALVAHSAYNENNDTDYPQGDASLEVVATTGSAYSSGDSHILLNANALLLPVNGYTGIVMQQVRCALLHPCATYTAGVGTWTGIANAWQPAGFGVVVTESGFFTDYINVANKGVGEFTALVGCTVRVSACITWVDGVAGKRSVGVFVNATRSGNNLTGGTEYLNSDYYTNVNTTKSVSMPPVILHLAAGNRLNIGKYAPANAVQSNQAYKLNWVTIEVVGADAVD